MTSEKDEFFYHENLVHPAALTHPRPVRALIVGGGDGGSAEELLKHPSIESVTLAEIDAAVVDISRKYLSSVHGYLMSYHWFFFVRALTMRAASSWCGGKSMTFLFSAREFLMKRNESLERVVVAFGLE